jgi:hypothetical protein
LDKKLNDGFAKVTERVDKVEVLEVYVDNVKQSQAKDHNKLEKLNKNSAAYIEKSQIRKGLCQKNCDPKRAPSTKERRRTNADNNRISILARVTRL